MDRLKPYRRKRNFKKTSEPRGRASRKSGARIFVIQKHSARRLHYDFRLELDGVLKSWAVPKGVSRSPGVRRLAVHTEDHPMDYANFEGEIPKGEYGAGKVKIWDRGHWFPEGDPRKALEKGKLRFELKGKLLEGVWNLIRTSDEKNWLLIKSKRSERLKSRRKVKESQRIVAVPRHSQTRDKFPALKVQLAVLKETTPDGDSWLHELKYDGYRLLLKKDGPNSFAYTRNGHNWTHKLQWIPSELNKLKASDVLMDVELVYLSKDGNTDFQKLQNSFRTNDSANLYVYAFDILYLNGRDLRNLPLIERKKILEETLKSAGSCIRLSPFVMGNGPKFLEEVCRQGFEGVVSKKALSPYYPSRHASWQKAKCQRRQEFVVGGFTESSGSQDFGALLIGYFDEGDLRYAGKVGTGFSDLTLTELGRRLRAIEEKKSPFKDFRESSRTKIHWVKPEIVIEVHFTEWTEDGRLRHPSFVGIRADKNASEVRREESGMEEVKIAGVILSHPDKILYEKQSVTKRMLAEYYVSIEEFILPFLVNRPLSLVRCPAGASKECFFQRHLGKDEGSDLPQFQYSSRSSGIVHYPFVKNIRNLVSLAQWGVLEIHQWGARVDRIDRPDQIVFDLDPSEEVAFTKVVEAANAMKAFLDELSLKSFVRTTGGKGLHIVIPIQRKNSWDEVKSFAKAVAQKFEEVSPEGFTSVMSKQKRKGKIFIDYLRNALTSTSISLLSTRARPGAPVAMPLSWQEVNKSLEASRFNIKTVPKLLRQRKQRPWKEFFAVNQSISKKHLRLLGVAND